MVDHKSEKERSFVNGRVVGGCSLHAEHHPGKCKSGLRHVGPWRVVDCCGFAGPDTDIIECAECGEQRKAGCTFDEEYS